ncbi:MAG: hypothetical protein A3E79_08430 [Burkholderiales bacterium RIFCSPHIGHO2_12_FULL_61_11]|nr:MAG: hypothetical protein A3E79_08430 [Burkholderiales bacterium RIFCSPHIGHO2_12_FULL_61_11]
MYGTEHGGWMFGGGDGGWMIFGWLWMILIGLVPVLLVFALVKYLLSSKNSGAAREAPRPTALDILDEAHARGEITREEYLQKRDDLQRKEGNSRGKI